MSMTKPVVGVAILMMTEEGKVRLNDPVSRFVPSFKELQVGVAVPAAPGCGRPRRGGTGRRPAPGAPLLHGACEREITVGIC